MRSQDTSQRCLSLLDRANNSLNHITNWDWLRAPHLHAPQPHASNCHASDCHAPHPHACMQALGVTELTLVNGMRVALHETRHMADEVLITAFAPGGLSEVHG